MKLYHFPRTRSARVLWAAHEMGAADDLELVTVNLLAGEHQKSEYGATHPHRKVPAFEDPAKNLQIIESGAIATWLQEVADKDNKLIPAHGTAERGRYWEWLFYTSATLDDVIIAAYVHTKVYPEPARDAALVARHAETWKRDAGPFVARRLGNDTWACGDQFTMADVFLGYDLMLAAGLGWLDEYPELQAYVGRATTRDGFKAAFS